MEKRENQRVMLSKRLIKESLIKLLDAGSLHKISVRMLCEEAGVNRSTFYRYYGSQYDVLAEMENDLLRSIQDALGDGDNGPGSAGRKIRVICSYLEENMSFVRTLIGNNVDPDFPGKLFSLPQIRLMILERLAGRYDREIQRYIYTFLVNGCYSLVQEWIIHGNGKHFNEVALLMQELIEKICGSFEAEGG